MPAHYRGNNYNRYRSPRRSVKRVRTVSDGVFWRIIVFLALFALGLLYHSYKFFVG